MQGGEWRLTINPECGYSKYLLGDSLIGFASCGAKKYEQDLFDGLEDYCEKEGGDPNDTHETMAMWLMQPVEIVGFEGSEMLRQLSVWVHALS